MTAVDLGVSVVIPTYNAASFLANTLDCVLAQGWTDLEIVVVDDGSTDDTPALLARYTAQYPAVFRVVRQENSGPPAARNTGILTASRPFVALLDHDDYWMPDKLARQMALLSHEAGPEICATGCIYRAYDAPPLRSIIDDWDDSPESVLHRLLISNCILTSSVVATRQALMTVGLFDTSLWWGDEYDLWLRLAAAGYHIGYVPEALVDYHRGPDNLSSQFHGQNLDPYIPAMTKRFRAGDLPASIQARRRWYLAHRHLNNACIYMDGHHREALASLGAAFWQRPASARPGWLVLCARALGGMVKASVGRPRSDSA